MIRRTLPGAALVAGSVAFGMRGVPEAASTPAPGVNGVSDSSVSGLYAAHCAPCHGDRGRADGEASDFLFPPARDFSRGSFRIVSTVNGVPLDSDLMATIRGGLPGTAMPPFPWLEESELAGLAQFVRGLAVDGLSERLERHALRRSSKESVAEIRARAVARLSPGARLPEWTGIGGFTTREHALERGAELYRASCAMCHGVDGQGTPAPRPTDDGEVSWARDLRLGELKGGATRQAIADRILAGMPGSAMPAAHFESDDLGALVEYVVEMLPDRVAEDPRGSAQEARRTLIARRVPAFDGDGLEPSSWEDVPPIRVPLAPLWWRADSIREVRLRAVHDGERLAIRVEWDDATSQPRLRDDAQRSDALALQFSDAPRPPLFGMGAPDHRTPIWYWRSMRLAEVAGWLDLVDARMRQLDGRGGERVDALGSATPSQEEWGSRRLDRFHGQGVGDVERMQKKASQTTVDARTTGEGWDVVFVRGLRAEGEGELSFAPGSAVQLCVAAWNGSAGDRGGQKAVSIWQELRLEP